MSASQDCTSLDTPSLLSAAAPAGLRPPRTWYFWGSTFFAVLTFLATNAVGGLVFLVLAIWYDVLPTAPDELKAVLHRGGWTEFAMIVATPFAVAVLWGATRLARQRFSDYLALRWPTRDEFLRGLAMLSVLLLAWFLLGWMIGQKIPAYVIDAYKNSLANGTLPVVVIAFCIAAPVTEEFVMRGFLLRGWSQSFLGPTGAIVLTSVVWTFMHTQYNWFYHAEIFFIGLLLGYLRYRSGSTWLTVTLHAAINGIALIEVAVVLAFN